MVQAMGVALGYPEILFYLRHMLARRPWGRSRLVHEGARLPALMAETLLGQAKLFVGLLEDLPYPHNRVIPDPARPGRISIDYTIGSELMARRALLRRLIARACGWKMAFLSRDPEPNWGHPCGTLRMGRAPGTSVTDGGGRVWGLPNLWVADASVFPTSMGVNPSLTIAAHALRVAQDITGGRS
jgi:choline dehydrogenase-like flavoprotein